MKIFMVLMCSIR